MIEGGEKNDSGRITTAPIIKEISLNMHNIVVYSTGCPRCNVLKKKLEMQGIQYTVETDVKKMTELGMMTAPGMSVDGGKIMNFNEAIHWLKGHQNG